MSIGYSTTTALYPNTSASPSKVTVDSDRRSLIRNRVLPWYRRGRKFAFPDYVKGRPFSDVAYKDIQINPGVLLSATFVDSHERLETQHEAVIPPPWPSNVRPETCPSITSVPSYIHKTFYHIHAPRGPTYYINHHLQPPNQIAFDSARSPVSAFSSSFPPLAIPQGSPPLQTVRLDSYAASADTLYSPPVNHCSSESVLPPRDSSSNVGFAGNASHQNRDGHNALSPWGQQFHHDSPYDLGQRRGKKLTRSTGGFGSVSVTDLHLQVPSSSAMSSPLSQSTPAVNLQSESAIGLCTRQWKWSKGRLPGVQTPPVFLPSPNSDTPSDNGLTNLSLVDHGAFESIFSITPSAVSSIVLPKTHSTAPEDLTPKLYEKKLIQFPLILRAPGYITSPEKVKKATVFSRIVKRVNFGMNNVISIGKRGMIFERQLGHKGSMSMSDVTALSKNPNLTSNVPSDLPHQEPLRKGPKRVPPPELEEALDSTFTSQIFMRPSPGRPGSCRALQSPQLVPDSTNLDILLQCQKNGNRHCPLSMDTEPDWSLGKLTIANPDRAGDASLRGKQNNPIPPFHQLSFPLMAPDSMSLTPVQGFQSLQLRGVESHRLVLPPLSQGHEGIVTSEKAMAKDLRISLNESSFTPTSMRFPGLHPTPQDRSISSVTHSDFFPPRTPSKTAERSKILFEESPYTPDISSSSKNTPRTEVPSPNKLRLDDWQKHIYNVNVSAESPRFTHLFTDGSSDPFIEKPDLPALPFPPKHKPANITNPPLTSLSSSHHSNKERETTIYTSLFTAPRSRRSSELNRHCYGRNDRYSQMEKCDDSDSKNHRRCPR